MGTEIITPINELKRRLENTEYPLPKRICLAKNSLLCNLIPQQKEEVILEWLKETIMDKEGICINNIMKWLNQLESSNEFIRNLVQILTEYFARKENVFPDIHCTILELLEKDKMFSITTLKFQGYFTFMATFLKSLKIDDDSKINDHNTEIAVQLLSSMASFSKRVLRKSRFVRTFMRSDLLHCLFQHYNTLIKKHCMETVKAILFPANKKTFYALYLHNIITTYCLKNLLTEHGEKISTIDKVLDFFKNFSEIGTNTHWSFLSNFAETFVYSYRDDGHLISKFFTFAFHCLDIQQNYSQHEMNYNPVKLIDLQKSRLKIYLRLIESLLEQDVDLNVTLSEQNQDKKDQEKKYFYKLVEKTTVHLLLKEGKCDVTAMQLITVSLKLDPALEQRLHEFLPHLMITKKKSVKQAQVYCEMLDTVLEMQFKMSKGPELITQILPQVQKSIEPLNAKQFELKQQLAENRRTGADCSNIKSNLLTLECVFPRDCINKFGLLTSKLLFRKESEIFEALVKQLEVDCLMLLEDGFVSPSIVILTELLTALLSSVLEHSRMCDHAVPQHISSVFWDRFDNFDSTVLTRFGECVIKLSYNAELISAFTHLAVSCSRLRLINARYSKFNLPQTDSPMTDDIYDMSAILKCLSAAKWRQLAEKVQRFDEGTIFDDLNNLLLHKVMFLELNLPGTENKSIAQQLAIKVHLIKDIHQIWNLLKNSPHFAKVLFSNLNANLATNIAKNMVGMTLKHPENINIFDNVVVTDSKIIMRSILVEINKKLLKFLEGNGVGLKPSLCKSLGDDNFEFQKFAKQVEVTEYFENLSTFPQDSEDIEVINLCLDIAKAIKVYALDENVQLLTLFVFLATKRCAKLCKTSKKIVKTIDAILLNLFEMTPKIPDIFKIFPINYVIAFGPNSFMDLLTLKLKSQNKRLPVKLFLDIAVKKVKTDPTVIREVVGILLSDQKTVHKVDKTISCFSNDVFEITCILLPLINKEKKVLTTSNYRTILTEMQEKLHKSLLKSFKKIKFNESEDSFDVLDALDSYTLTLVRYCESTNANDSIDLEIILENLKVFYDEAQKYLNLPETKQSTVLSCLKLLNATLRNHKKLQKHAIFVDKNSLPALWETVKKLLKMADGNSERIENKMAQCVYIDELATTVRFLAESCSVEFFNNKFVIDLFVMCGLKPLPKLQSSKIQLDQSSSNHCSMKFIIQSLLNTHISGEKSSILSKAFSRISKNLAIWIKTHYASLELKDFVTKKEVVKVDDSICEILKMDLDVIAEMVLAAKKITLSFKCIDSLFEALHFALQLLNCQIGGHIVYEMSSQSYFDLFEAVWACLNNLSVSRGELIEDRWHCYLKLYRYLLTSLSVKSNESDENLEKIHDEKMAECSLAIEKLTQSITKKKHHISHLSTYVIADLCQLMESAPPARNVRQNFENCIVSLIQVSDSTKQCMAFLKRSLADSKGGVTFTNIHGVYKKYHKFSGAF